MGKQIILHPSDWQTVQLEVAKSGGLTAPSLMSNGPSTLWGIPVVISNEVPAGKVLLGDLSAARTLAVNHCGCCGATGAEKDLLPPSCACYLKTAGEEPILCSHCNKCELHHADIPFGVCAKPEIVQNVIRTRTRERARRAVAGAE